MLSSRAKSCRQKLVTVRARLGQWPCHDIAEAKARMAGTLWVIKDIMLLLFSLWQREFYKIWVQRAMIKMYVFTPCSLHVSPTLENLITVCVSFWKLPNNL